MMPKTAPLAASIDLMVQTRRRKSRSWASSDFGSCRAVRDSVVLMACLQFESDQSNYLPRGPKNAKQNNHYGHCGRVGPKLQAANIRGRLGKGREGIDYFVQSGWLNCLPAGDAGYLSQHFGTGGAANPFDLGPLHEHRGVESGRCLLARYLQLMAAGFFRCECGRELAPFFARGCEANGLCLARRCGDASQHVAARQRLTASFHDIALEDDRLAGLRLLRRIVEPHRLALRHVPLVGHPADDLAPETIMIFVFNPFPPPPGSVGSHKQHFSRPECAGG